MSPLIMRRALTAPIRDPRYASLWELAGPATGLNALSAALVEVDPGATSPRHWHVKTEEVYLIVDGIGLMHIGDETLPLQPGDCVSIPVRMIHAIANIGDHPLRMWVVTSPVYDEADDHEVDLKSDLFHWA